jgi:hypothetical protein
MNASGIHAGGDPTITYNSILRNTATNNAAIFLNVGYDVGDFSSNTIMDNVNSEFDNLRAVYIEYGSPTFNGNNIYRNNGYAVYNNNAQGSPTINAENNWWGTASSPAIQTLIYDWFDDPNKGIVDFSPYRTGINTAAPVSPPIGVVITPNLSLMGVSWTANPESDMAGYKVYWDTDSRYPYANSVDVGNVTSYNIPGLSGGTDYYIAVTAYDSSTDGMNDMTDGNESWFSLEKTARLPAPPAAFDKIGPSNGAGGQSTAPTLTWETSTDATSYEYCYDTTDNNACSTWIDNGVSTSKTLSGLSQNTTYYWHVRAVNTLGTTYSNSSETAFWSFTTRPMDETPPTVLSITRVDPNPTNLASVDFTVTFSEPVTGVDESGPDFDDFTLTTSAGISNASVTVVNGSGETYTVTVTTGSGNGTLRLDVVSGGNIQDAANNPLAGGFTTGEVYSIIKTATFADVPLSYWASRFIEQLYYNGITGGCSTSPMMYCPEATVTRAQMAVFLLVAEHGTGYTPPDATGIFNDVPAENGFAKWIEQLAAEGITGGCGNGNYCPNSPVTREQMSVFLLVAMNGTGYTPPAATGVFADVPVSNPFAPWIEALAAEGITGGCGGGNFCPKNTVNRAQMAVFLVTAFNLP